jgi:glycosyltransferase involved in cell wall biosynthesis
MTKFHHDQRVFAHNAEVFPMQKGAKGARAFLRYRNVVRDEPVKAFLAIEFHPMYLFPLLNASDTTVIMWLQDPRTSADWHNIATCKLAYSCEPNNTVEPIGKLTSSISYNLLKKTAILRKNKIIPATQARFLRQKGYEKYQDRMFLNSIFLPNPVRIPDSVVQKAKKPTILFLGRVDPIKRPWLFFEVARRMPDCDFVVAGLTHYPQIMKDCVEDAQRIPNLHFLGLVGGSKKEEVLGKSWILFNSSIHEALPVSFLEALSHKTPIVSNQNPDGITEKYGIRIKDSVGDGYDSTTHFVTAINKLVNEEDLRRELGQKGFEYVRNQHSFFQFEQQLNRILSI